MTKVKQRTSRLLIAALTLILTVGLIAAMPTDVHAQGGADFDSAKYLAPEDPDEGEVGYNAYESKTAYYKIKTTYVPGMRYKVFVKGSDVDWPNLYQGSKYSNNEYVDYTDRNSAGGTLRVWYDNLGLGKEYIVEIGHAGVGWCDYSVELVRIGTRSKIISAPAGKKKITVNYKKKNGATRYQIQCKRVGKSWTQKSAVKTVTSKKLKATITKRLSGKKYNVRVRAQHKANGQWYNGKWSKVKTVKVK